MGVIQASTSHDVEQSSLCSWLHWHFDFYQSTRRKFY